MVGEDVDRSLAAVDGDDHGRFQGGEFCELGGRGRGDGAESGRREFLFFSPMWAASRQKKAGDGKQVPDFHATKMERQGGISRSRDPGAGRPVPPGVPLRIGIGIECCCGLLVLLDLVLEIVLLELGVLFLVPRQEDIGGGVGVEEGGLTLLTTGMTFSGASDFSWAIWAGVLGTTVRNAGGGQQGDLGLGGASGRAQQGGKEGGEKQFLHGMSQ